MHYCLATVAHYEKTAYTSCFSLPPSLPPSLSSGMQLTLMMRTLILLPRTVPQSPAEGVAVAQVALVLELSMTLSPRMRVSLVSTRGT